MNIWAVSTHEKLLTSSGGGLRVSYTGVVYLLLSFTPDETESRKKSRMEKLLQFIRLSVLRGFAKETFPLNWQDLLKVYIGKKHIEVLQNIDPDHN